MQSQAKAGTAIARHLPDYTATTVRHQCPDLHGMLVVVCRQEDATVGRGGAVPGLRQVRLPYRQGDQGEDSLTK